MLAILTGIPGTGKTTVATEAMKILEKENIRYEMITFGTVIFELAQQKKLVKDRDEMRKLTPAVQRDIQREAAKKIAKMAKGKNILIDTHCTISTPKGYIPGLPEWVLKELNPDAIVLVEADSIEIDKRRKSDPTRKRDDEGVSGIQMHQDMNRAAAMSYSSLTGAAVKVIKNPQGKIEEAAGKLAEILR